MKYFIFLFTGLIFCGNFAFAQDETDVLKYSQTFMKGSARFTAMGGAFGALGGDMSSFMINPAGVGVYRSSEFTFSTGIFNSNQKIDFNGYRSFDGHTSANVGNAGIVLNLFNNGAGELRNFNIGVSYNRVNDFNQNASIYGVTDRNGSIMNSYAVLAKNADPNELLKGYGPWKAVLAMQTGVIIPKTNAQGYTSTLGEGELVLQDQYDSVRGFNDVVNVAFGGNVLDVAYFGGSVNIANINYHSIKKYVEGADKNNKTNFDELYVEDIYNAYGAGASLSLGVILKPIHEIRIGVSYTSPTWMTIDEDYSAYMSSTFLNSTPAFIDAETSINTTSYRISSPQKITGSLGFILGNYGIISADVDWVNYASMRMHSNRDNRDRARGVNAAIDETYRNTINARVGGELRLDNYALRAGYQYCQNPYNKDFINSDNATSIYSAGFGYRTRSFFIDFAYSLMNLKDSFSLYEYSDIATSTMNRNSYIMTLGFKF